MDKKEFIKEYLVEAKHNVSFIINSKLAKEIAFEMNKDGITFLEANLEDIYLTVKENEIISLAKYINEYNCKEEYLFQEVLYSGGTLADEVSRYIFIEEDLVDNVDLDKFIGKTYGLEKIIEGYSKF